MITETAWLAVNGVGLYIDYTYKPLVKGVYDKAPEDCYEDEPAEIEIKYVFIGKIDITELLSEGVINKIIDEIEKQQR